ncbi:MAG: hypothetical protein E7551_06165 [Ruminococcaceae bacterium]|nr:hypothetical protein [Oscillospiraceae bacterium]
MLKIIFICLCVVYGFLYFIFAVGTNKPFKTIIFYAFIGLAGLTLVNLTSKLSNVFIPINAYTLSISALLGLPGTISLLLLQMIFI